MSRKIEVNRVTTNLKVLDKVKRIQDDDDRTYKVVYIDLNRAQAVLVSINYANNALIINLNTCYDFDIID